MAIRPKRTLTAGVAFPNSNGAGLRRRILIRGSKGPGDNVPGTTKAAKRKEGIAQDAGGMPSKPKKLMVGFTQDLVALGNIPYYAASNVKGKLESSMAQALIARMLVLGLTQKKIAGLLGYRTTSSVTRLITKPNFNDVLLEARASLFGDLESPLKTIYLRAVNRLQNMVASPDDGLALEACKIVIQAMRQSPKQVEEAPKPVNQLEEYKLTPESRTMGLSALKKMRDEEMASLVRQRVMQTQ